jgi:hypothetical protein
VASLKAGQMEVFYYEVAPHILIGAFLYSHDWRPALLCALAALSLSSCGRAKAQIIPRRYIGWCSFRWKEITRPITTNRSPDSKASFRGR